MQFRDRLVLRNRPWYPWLFPALSIGGLLIVWTWASPDHRLEYSLSVLGLAAGLVGFLYAKHREDTRLFMELFQSFNSRYDTLNDDLNRIADSTSPEPLGPDDRNRLFDYFNLCAEEYLFYSAGYIDEQVWKAWTRGMAHFAADERIRHLWEEELRQESYYGFTLKELELSKADR